MLFSINSARELFISAAWNLQIRIWAWIAEFRAGISCTEPGHLPQVHWLPGWHWPGKPFGRIAIANSDAAANAMLEAAVKQGYRAVTELI